MNVPAKTGGLTPTNMTEAIQFSEMLAASALVPKNFQGRPADILVAVQWGSEVGLPPLAALNGIAVINGKPSLYGDAAMSLVCGHPQYAGHSETIEGEEAICLILRLVNGKEIETRRTFSVKDARLAGLMNKAGPWKQYPKRMLQMRARGFAIRDAFPDALKGVITYEEASDLGSEGGSIKDITPANPLDVIEAIETNEEEDDIAEEEKWFLNNGITIKPYPTVEGWMMNFQMDLDTTANTIADTFTVRRHNCSEYKKLNEDVIAKLETDYPNEHKIIKATYLKLIKSLSVKAKENGE